MTELSKINEKYEFIQQNYKTVKETLIQSLKSETTPSFKDQNSSENLVNIFTSDLINILADQLSFIHSIYFSTNQNTLSDIAQKNNETFISSITILYKKILHLINQNNINKQNNNITNKKENIHVNNSENTKKKSSFLINKEKYPKKSIINLTELFNGKDSRIIEIQKSPKKNKEIKKNSFIHNDKKNVKKEKKSNSRKYSNSNKVIKSNKSTSRLTSIKTEGNNNILQISLDNIFNQKIQNNKKRNSKNKFNHPRKPVQLIQLSINNAVNNFRKVKINNIRPNNIKLNSGINLLKLSHQSPGRMTDVGRRISTASNTVKINLDQSAMISNNKRNFNSFISNKYYKKKNNKSEQKNNLSGVNERVNVDKNLKLYIKLLNNNKAKNKK